MITAEKAREKTNSSLTKIEKKLEELSKLIESASEQGKNSISIFCQDSDTECMIKVKNNLEELGYTIKINTEGPQKKCLGKDYIISW